jgi:Vanadium chloroperoxidase N-terminal domain
MDYILYWNEVALDANKLSHSIDTGSQKGPCLSSRALAIIHLAMYEAFAAVSNDPAYPTYYPALPPPPVGTSVNASITGAAYVTISALYPEMQPTAYDKYLKAGLSGAGVNEGVAYGCLIAQIVLQDRGNDPSVDGFAHIPGIEKLSHRPDPDNATQGFYAPNYGPLSKGFAITQRWGLLPPPPLGSEDYKAAYKQVKSKGIAPELMGDNPDRRTTEETIIGLFWAYDGAKNLGTPPRLYNQIVRKVAIHKNNTQAQNAKLFALVNVAMADAGILAWDVKYTYNLARPVIAIREADKSLGPAAVPGNNVNTLADIEWLPFGAPNSNRVKKNFTPNFPAYPSGHATFGAASLHMVRLFYGVNTLGPDHLLDGLSFVSDEMDGMTLNNKETVRPKHVREFKEGLYQMMIENGFSRVYLGVHWSFDAFAVDKHNKPDLSKNIGGIPLGIKIAEDIYQHGLKPSLVGTKYPLIPKLM